MSQDNTALQSEISQLRRDQHRQYAGFCVQLLPIEIHNGRQYAIEWRHKTDAGYDRLDAIDLTDFEDGQQDKPYMLAARFDADFEPIDDGAFVAAIWPDEGAPALITQTCRHRGYGSWCVALSADPNLDQQLMDELERSVDAGGAVWP